MGIHHEWCITKSAEWAGLYQEAIDFLTQPYMCMASHTPCMESCMLSSRNIYAGCGTFDLWLPWYKYGSDAGG